MHFLFTLMTEEDAHEVCTWRYDGPYAVYNITESPESIQELLDRRSPYYAVRNEQGTLIGFFCFGTSALVWGSDEPGIYGDIYEGNKTLALGLGLRPDLTGQGLGLPFVEAGLDFARRTFAPHRFLLFVFSWNERAIRVYVQAGFVRAGTYLQQRSNGQSEFVRMEKDARGRDAEERV